MDTIDRRNFATDCGSEPILRKAGHTGRLPSARFLRSFTYILKRIWLKALRRRSQRDRFSWQRLQALVDRYWPKPWIRHPWPEQRFDVKYPR